MTTVLIVIHLMVVLAMIGLVLLQRSEGGALGIGGGSGAFMTGRGAGNVLTTSTAILAATFFVTSLGLALLSRMEGRPTDIFDTLPASQTAPAPVETPSVPPPPTSGAGGSSSEDMLRQLNGSAGPQTPPAESGAAGETPPATNEAAPAAPAANEPAPATPAAEGGASPQVPPSGGNSQ
jgi:preprotein translocase subunit SecG